MHLSGAKGSRTFLRTKSMHFWWFLVKIFLNNWCQAAAEPSPVGSCPAKFRSNNAYVYPEKCYAICNNFSVNQLGFSKNLCIMRIMHYDMMHYEKVYCKCF